MLTIQEYQEFPFEALASAVESQSYSNRESLCRVLIAYNVEGFLDKMPGVTFAPLYLKEAQTAENLNVTAFDFIFRFLESSTKLSGTVNFRNGQWESRFPYSINDYLKSILEAILLRPSVPISLSAFGRRYTEPENS